MKNVASALLLSAAISTPVFAADQGFYVAVDVGPAIYSGAKSQFSSTNFADPSAITLGGGYHFNQNVGVEANYSVLTDSTITTYFLFGGTVTQTLKASSLQVAAVGTLPLGEKFELFGKLGLANTTIDYTATPTGLVPAGITQTASASKTNPMFAIGGQFNFNKHFSLRVQYRDLGKVQLPGLFYGGVSAPNIGVKIISVGGVYNF